LIYLLNHGELYYNVIQEFCSHATKNLFFETMTSNDSDLVTIFVFI